MCLFQKVLKSWSHLADLTGNSTCVQRFLLSPTNLGVPQRILETKYWRGQGFCDGLFSQDAPKVISYSLDIYLSWKSLNSFSNSPLRPGRTNGADFCRWFCVLWHSIYCCCHKPSPLLEKCCLYLCALSAILDFLLEKCTCTLFFSSSGKPLKKHWKLKSPSVRSTVG
jgi:hypothetical protein